MLHREYINHKILDSVLSFFGQKFPSLFFASFHVDNELDKLKVKQNIAQYNYQLNIFDEIT
jgi:hypothetical protein